MKLDTGAYVNVFPSRFANKIGFSRPFQPTQHQLFGYGGKPLKVEGKIKLSCTYKGLPNVWKST